MTINLKVSLKNNYRSLVNICTILHSNLYLTSSSIFNVRLNKLVTVYKNNELVVETSYYKTNILYLINIFVLYLV